MLIVSVFAHSLCWEDLFYFLCQAASSNWFHRMTLLSGGAHLLKPGAALDQVYNKEINTKKNFAMMFVFSSKVAWKVTGSNGRPWRKIQQLISRTSHSCFIVVIDIQIPLHLYSLIIMSILRQVFSTNQVRNPMDRLVSAYRNKLECRAGKEYYYKVKRYYHKKKNIAIRKTILN